jgi:alpha-D-ribose 1-methylphosphonate 5-triphosphate diphosphatase PhnM
MRNGNKNKNKNELKNKHKKRKIKKFRIINKIILEFKRTRQKTLAPNKDHQKTNQIHLLQVEQHRPPLRQIRTNQQFNSIVQMDHHTTRHIVKTINLLRYL